MASPRCPRQSSLARHGGARAHCRSAGDPLEAAASNAQRDSMALTPQPPPPAGPDFTGNVLFYSKPEPLSREMHAKIGLRRVDKPFGFAATSNVVPITVAEFPVAGISYPII